MRPGDAAHEQHGDERGDERHADRNHREADLPGADERRLHRPHALLDVAVDVLDHDDGVVDDEADSDGEGHQRQVVDRVAERPHGGAGAGQRQRHGDARGDGRRHAPQEDEHHHHHERDGEQQRELHVVHAGADRRRAVGQHLDVDARRDPALQVGDQRFDADRPCRGRWRRAACG